MSKRTLAWFATVTALVALVSIFFFDRPLALLVHRSGIEHAVVVEQVRQFLDVFMGRGWAGRHGSLGQLVVGALFIAVGVLWTIARRSNHAARALIFAGVVQLSTIEATWLIKAYFGRLRPIQLLASNGWDHIWFVGGDSFPSGHNAFFWGLLLPLSYLYPKWRFPLLIIPVFIAFARVDESYHFLSDVLTSIALAAVITLLAAVAFGRWVRPAISRHSEDRR